MIWEIENIKISVRDYIRKMVDDYMNCQFSLLPAGGLHFCLDTKTKNEEGISEPRLLLAVPAMLCLLHRSLASSGEPENKR